MEARSSRGRVAVISLGCKLNQAEGEAMRHRCAAAGYELVPFGADADVYVVNTCTVTAEADREGRRLARRARRLGPPGARIILAGCSPQADAAGMRIPEADLLLGNAEKLRLDDHLARPARREEGLPEVRVAPIEERLDIETVALPHFEGRTRAFLKVQDGCDFSCTFCATTLARGKGRSLGVEECLAQAEGLAAGGHREIVLTGIHLGAYGRDLERPATLSRLVSRLLGASGLTRLRLSSVEPGEMTGELLRLAAQRAYRAAPGPDNGQGGGGDEGGAYLCRHFHIPVQSGDDGVLASMERNYRAGACARRFDTLAREIPGVCLGADFLVGFPGESAEAFGRTLEWVREAPLAYLHVFPFSSRPGTPAAEMGGAPSPPAMRERSEALRELGRRKWGAFLAAQAGAEAEVLVESRGAEDGLLTGLTDNYVRVRLEGPDAWIGRAVPMRLEPLSEEGEGARRGARGEAMRGAPLS